jgi:hypothetical protein
VSSLARSLQVVEDRFEPVGPVSGWGCHGLQKIVVIDFRDQVGDTPESEATSPGTFGSSSANERFCVTVARFLAVSSGVSLNMPRRIAKDKEGPTIEIPSGELADRRGKPART